MAADLNIDKVSVFDDRVVQSAPRYAIVKGANSINSMPFAAQTESAAQHQYTIQVPNQGVYMDRALLWTSTVYLKASFEAVAAIAADAAIPLAPGYDFALAAFPLHRLVQTITATVNNQNVTFNCDVLDEVLRLADEDENRKRRTCPTYLDTLAAYESSDGASDPIAGTANAYTDHVRPNGEYPHLEFVTQTGARSGVVPLFADAVNTYQYTVLDGMLRNTSYVTLNPVVSVAIPINTVIPIYLSAKSTEKFILSPFIFSEIAERDTGIFGLNNVMITLNMTSPTDNGHVGRIIRCKENGGAAALRDLAYHPVNGRVFSNSRIDVQFLDPNWEVPLPSRSMVPWMEYSRYLTTSANQVLPSRSNLTRITTGTITLPYIPDLLVFSVKPSQYTKPAGPAGSAFPGGLAAADYSFPIHQLALQWANRSGLLSTHTPEQIYEMCYANGLRIPFSQWFGLVKSGKAALDDPAYAERNPGNAVATSGSFLVLRPGVDFVLDPGQAPGMVGNFVVQAALEVYNPFGATFTGDLRVCVMAVNSGFFATVYGSSAIMRGVLSPADVTSPTDTQVTDQSLTRLIGAGRNPLWGKLGSAATWLKDHLPAMKAVASAAKPHMNADVQNVMSAVGLGYGGHVGGGVLPMSGGKRGRLSERVGY